MTKHLQESKSKKKKSKKTEKLDNLKTFSQIRKETQDMKKKR